MNIFPPQFLNVIFFGYITFIFYFQNITKIIDKCKLLWYNVTVKWRRVPLTQLAVLYIIPINFHSTFHYTIWYIIPNQFSVLNSYNIPMVYYTKHSKYIVWLFNFVYYTFGILYQPRNSKSSNQIICIIYQTQL